MSANKDRPTDEKCAASLLLTWRRRAIRASNAHYEASKSARKWGIFLTVMNVTFALVVLFLTNNSILPAKILGMSIDLLTSLAGLLIVVTSVLQYILRFDEKARDNKTAGNDFSNIKRDIEEALIAKQITENLIKETKFAHAFASKSAPIVNSSQWKIAHEKAFKPLTENEVFEDQIIEKFGICRKDLEYINGP